MDSKVNEQEVIRRLKTMLEADSYVHTRKMSQFYSANTTEGDNDIIFFADQTNYVVQVKFGKGTTIVDSIKQLMGYIDTKFGEKRISFVKAIAYWPIGNRDREYFLAVHFNETYGGWIDDWILLPFQGQILRFDQMKCSSMDILFQLL